MLILNNSVITVFKNCEAYNVPKKNSHIVALARHCIKAFKKLFLSIISSWEATSTKRVVDIDTTESLSRAVDLSTGPLSKKMKLDHGAKTAMGSRKSLLVANPATTSTALPRPTASIKNTNKLVVARENIPRILIKKVDGPIPLHVAIAQIKDSFSSRRLHKDLDSWEGACSRFYRELMRHPWLSASRPKFIFSCPVPILFPELKEAYSAKIAKPMDLTTIECKLLQGGLYKSPQDMTDDAALVFSNAVAFNKAGYEEGEPLSCAYYDASRHLLRYARWLSLECFDQYLIDNMHEDGAKQVGPIPSWKLRRSYWKDAKEEMEDIVFNQVIEISDEVRYTWMESECEKLLKCLRHQSDCKKMEFFLESTYPPDYSSYIAKPMDWKSCEKTLQQRKYRTFGDIVGDLRLIFSNAVVYNGRAKGTDSVSGRAYDAAIYMSGKFESYISKMLVSVSDRLLRERIDEIILQREQRAAEKAEWQQQRERMKSVDMGKRSPDIPSDRNTGNRSSFISFRNVESSYYDDEPPSHDLAQQYIANQHRSLLEKQFADRVKMQRTSTDIGNRVFRYLVERSRAILWAQSRASDMKEKEALSRKKTNTTSANGTDPRVHPEPILNRSSIKMNLGGKAKAKVCKVRPPPIFDDQ